MKFKTGEYILLDGEEWLILHVGILDGVERVCIWRYECGRLIGQTYPVDRLRAWIGQV